MKQIISNIKYTFSANFITLLISVIITLVLPRKLGVSDYGYYQLYLFYISYASIFHFGLPDGIYLNIGGEYYENLDKIVLKKQLIVLFFGSILMASLFFLGINFTESDRRFIYLVSIVCIFITNIKVYLLFILQATNRIREYAKYTRMDRILFFILCLTYILFISNSFATVIILDLFSKLVSVLLLCYFMKDIVFLKVRINLLDTIKKSIQFISVGIKLMLSYVAGLLIIGVIRFAIEAKWSINTFSKVSLVLSLSNMMMTFINAVSVVLFPILRRINSKNQRIIFFGLRNLLLPISFGLIIVFYPLQFFIQIWLPNYADSIFYLGILFPLFIYEGKVSLLSNTFLKTLRKEKTILKINILSLILSVLLAAFSTMFNNVLLAILSILIVIIFRSNFSEFSVSKYFNESTAIDIFIELFLTLIFVVFNIILPVGLSFLGYSLAYICYLFIKKSSIINAFKILKSIEEI
ncbi:oligosaccharide flippase family protein [Enterococcus gallinarum]|uniref:oligosaccharide flippase family protein n=1 Tax=Enterococcus gallinarum TaxID=1353 RepID=UPI0011DD9D53|nr:oligosaccharide flippase family protein [Enterococcus gallinarum]MEB6053353.1 oligosaccharide flippase family protein [Enterococcus gallinarum]TXT69156.1 hypothetical protein D4N12_06755 [Enterococcus gallinarum]